MYVKYVLHSCTTPLDAYTVATYRTLASTYELLYMPSVHVTLIALAVVNVVCVLPLPVVNVTEVGVTLPTVWFMQFVLAEADALPTMLGHSYTTLSE